jgi:hypothetical protein
VGQGSIAEAGGRADGLHRTEGEDAGEDYAGVAPMMPTPESAAIGAEYQPLPGHPMFLAAETARPGAEVLAEPGSPVHAVLSGRVHRSGPGLELRADDGRVVGYRGTAAVRWTVRDGEHLRAGRVVGRVADTAPDRAPGTLGDLSGPAAPPPTMIIYLARPDGEMVDPVAWLSGLADPAEGSPEPSWDPFRTDLRLAESLAPSDGPTP